MADPEDVTKRLDAFLRRPSTLLELCREAGKEDEYRRVQQALRRWRDEKGQGLSDEDAEWIEELLEELQ